MYGVAAYHGAFLGSPASNHHRSASVGPSPTPAKSNGPLSKAKSTNSLRAMANGDGTPPLPPIPHTENAFRTIQDPRTASTSDLSRSGSTSSRNVDAKDEVAVLSNKLINAINHQQKLDDTLAQTRHELEAMRAKAAHLEAKAKEYEERMARGDILTKSDVDKLNEKLSTDLEDERKQKTVVQEEKKSIEAELENLTASLFDEANKMVAAANSQKEATEKKNQQLRDQIKDGEALIASQTEQLTELKQLMQELGSDHRKEVVDSPRSSAAPSSPAFPRDDGNIVRLLEAMNLSPVTPDQTDVAPTPSTHLVHLIKPQCRTDVPSFDDFKNMLASNPNPRSHTPSHAPSRAGSGSYSALSGLGLSALAQSNSSNPNLASTTQSTSKLAPSPGIPGSFSPSVDPRGPIALKETRFFKRIMVEDIEPTLRLDLSPSISWLQRRSLLAAVADSTLMVEPIPEASQKLYGKYTPCTVCGEARKEGQNPRTHAMRLKEGESANKWSVCTLCLEKVRAVCDLVGYVKMVRDGVVKIADLKDEEEVWEEIIRLRERLFWARLSGGVIPAFIPSSKSSPVVNRVNTSDSTEDANKENRTPGFQTPSQSRRGSEEAKRSAEDARIEEEANLQLQAGLNDSLTTFQNAREQALRRASAQSSPVSPPITPGKKRESGGFPKINIPRMPSLPQGFWESQVNSLH